MPRRIIDFQYQGAASPPMDGYFDKVIKYIPSDVVAAWLLVTSLIKSDNTIDQATVSWIAFAFVLVFTFFWMRWQTTKENTKTPHYSQTVIATIAFAVWAFALGAPFAYYDFYRPTYGSLALIGFTLVAPLLGGYFPAGNPPPVAPNPPSTSGPQ
ncbi:MAG TPA: hypothetical protein VD866_28860 [Urbifossiella sp.]|nr:hypothetical protein [Urbifossiella sp.]